MAYEVRPNSFIIFKNYRKNKPNDCDMSGEMNIDGETFYFMNGWCKDDKNGNLMISGSLKRKQGQGEQQAPSQQQQRQAQTPPIFRNPTPKPTTPPEQYPERNIPAGGYKEQPAPKPDDSFDPDDIPF